MKALILLLSCISIVACNLDAKEYSISHNQDNYKKTSLEKKKNSVNQTANNIAKWYGSYLYSNYEENESTATGIGATYVIRINKDICTIDIEGFQIDNHINCKIKSTKNANIAKIVDKSDNSEFGQLLHKSKDKYYLKLNSTSADDVNPHLLEKQVGSV